MTLRQQLRYLENETAEEEVYVQNLRKVQAAEEELRKERDRRAREIEKIVGKHLEQSGQWASKLYLDTELEDKDIERKTQGLNRKGEKHRRAEE